MTPKQFWQLDEMEQAELIWEGNHISDRHTDLYTILLYQIDDLFIEVYYHKANNVIWKFEAYNRQELLYSYLPKN